MDKPQALRQQVSTTFPISTSRRSDAFVPQGTSNTCRALACEGSRRSSVICRGVSAAALGCERSEIPTPDSRKLNGWRRRFESGVEKVDSAAVHMAGWLRKIRAQLPPQALWVQLSPASVPSTSSESRVRSWALRAGRAVADGRVIARLSLWATQRSKPKRIGSYHCRGLIYTPCRTVLAKFHFR